MASSGLRDFLNRVTDFTPLLLVAIGVYYGLDYYELMVSDASPVKAKDQQIASLQSDIARMQGKVKEMEQFHASLESRKLQLREHATRLDEMKGSLSDTFDSSEFMRLVVTEAKKVGLSVLRLEPQAVESKEYYAQHAFSLSFRGVYQQLLVFLDRISNVQKIVRVDELTLKPIGNGSARFVQLEGTMEIRAYRYLSSSADSLARNETQVPALPKGASGSEGGGP
jgi:Tfp pilus assembly protein PilO